MEQGVSCRGCGNPIPEARKRYNAVYCSRLCMQDANKQKYREINPDTLLSSGTVGAVSELVVCADLLKRGYEVFRAVSPSCSCDLAILKEGKLHRVEVRTATTYEKKDGTLSHMFVKADPSKSDVQALVNKHTHEISYVPEALL